MDQESVRPHRHIATRIKELREARGWSAQRLAEEMAAVGIPWERMVVTKLENGRRQSVTVEELLALAYVLDVAPVNLLVPVDSAQEYAYVPADTALSGPVREWVRGRFWMPRQGGIPGGERRYFADVPDEEWAPPSPETPEEAERRRAARDAWLQARLEAGQLVRHEEPGGVTRWERPSAG